MSRWEPGARERLVAAALELFIEQGYDETTVAQISERAGVTKSTFHRHFPDKRDLLAAGQETLSALLSAGILQAAPELGPLDAVAVGLERASGTMGAVNRDLAPIMAAAIAASDELRERHDRKAVGMAEAMTTALIARGVPEPTARVASEIGGLAFREGYEAWAAGDRSDTGGMAPHALAALAELREAAAALS